MPKLAKRLPYELAIAAAIVLGSCNDHTFNDKQIDAISDIAGPVAEEAVSESTKIKDLEDRVESIESRLNMED